MALVLALVIAAATAIASFARATPADAWHRGRSILLATQAARRVPGACALGVRSIKVYRSGGYTYWHRDLPIYFDTWDASQVLEHTEFRLNLDSVLDGHHVPQHADGTFSAHPKAFNVLIGAPTDGLPGFSAGTCFGDGTRADPTFCVFTRPGGCA